MTKMILSTICFVFISLTTSAFADIPSDSVPPASTVITPSTTGVQENRVELQHQPQQTDPLVSPTSPTAPQVQIPPEFAEHYAPPSTLEEDHFYHEFFKMLSMLGLIIMLLLLASWFLKRMLSSRTEQINNTSLIKIVEKRMLSAKSVVYVIDVMGKKIVLAESQNGITSLGDLAVKDIRLIDNE